jgi:hypothetical protein
MNRTQFIEECRVANKKFFSRKAFLLTYLRDNKNRRTGVVLAYKYRGKIFIGYAKCNTKLERFEREIGIAKAIERAFPAQGPYPFEIPHSIASLVKKMRERAERYFRLRVDESWLEKNAYANNLVVNGLAEAKVGMFSPDPMDD